jgi:energy-coupling factor transporter ATP-binding protein EcfA2
MAGNTEISVQNLTYFHDPSGPPSLSNINISLPKGSRTLLIGANGGVHLPHSDRRQSLSTLIFISWQVNTASNSSGQATGHI